MGLRFLDGYLTTACLGKLGLHLNASLELQAKGRQEQIKGNVKQSGKKLKDAAKKM